MNTKQTTTITNTLIKNTWYYIWFNNYILNMPITEFNWEFLTYYLPINIILLYKDLIGHIVYNNDTYYDTNPNANDYDKYNKYIDVDYDGSDAYSGDVIDMYSCNIELKDSTFYHTWHWKLITDKVPIDFIIQNKHFGWDWYIITDKVPITFILNNIDFDWNYNSEKLAHIIPSYFIIQNKNKNWNWHILFFRSDMDREFVFIQLVEQLDEWKTIPDYINFDYIISRPHISWNYSNLSSFPNISSEYVLQNPDLNWNWSDLSENLNISLSFIVNTLDILPWDIDMVCDRNDITINFIIRNNLFHWNISNNTNIEINNILRNKKLFDSIKENDFKFGERSDITLELLYEHQDIIPYLCYNLQNKVIFTRQTLFTKKYLDEAFKGDDPYYIYVALPHVIQSCIRVSTKQVIESEGNNSLSFIEMNPLPWWDYREIIEFYVDNVLLVNRIHVIDYYETSVEYILELIKKNNRYSKHKVSKNAIINSIWYYISRHKKITTHYFDTHSSLGWNIEEIYKNLSISIDYLVSKYDVYKSRKINNILSSRNELRWDIIINNPQIDWCYGLISKNKMLFGKKLHSLKEQHTQQFKCDDGINQEIISTVLHPDNYHKFINYGL